MDSVSDEALRRNAQHDKRASHLISALLDCDEYQIPECASVLMKAYSILVSVSDPDQREQILEVLEKLAPAFRDVDWVDFDRRNEEGR